MMGVCFRVEEGGARVLVGPTAVGSIKWPGRRNNPHLDADKIIIHELLWANARATMRLLFAVEFLTCSCGNGGAQWSEPYREGKDQGC